MKAFRVLAYSRDALLECLVDASLSSQEDLERKLHIRYFTDYFSALGARTILVESGYVDHDYLEDYAAYYVRCFQRYKRHTQRLHFFNQPFSEHDFHDALVNPASAFNARFLQDGYLGFVVVKPLPQTIIGRTCLITYPADGGRRSFPILRDYPVNLFGFNLKVASLAFQEQDTVVAACATSALWSCFQGTGKLFQHAIPSPVEITKAATDHVPESLPATSARALPNSGLTATQMALAIRNVGLEPYILSTTSTYILNSTLYAYLKCKIPPILGFQLYDLVAGVEHLIGGHAVALTGFSTGISKPKPFGPSGFLLRASRIDKVYAHDDQVGPFSRMEHAFSTRDYLATSWRGKGNVEALPLLLLLPLYHKIRIPFETIHDAVLILDSVLDPARAKAYPTLPRPEWDIYLTTVNEFKSDVLDAMRSLLGSAVEHSLTAVLWRVTARCGSDHHLDLLFDATGIAQHQLLVHVVKVRPELPALIAACSGLVKGQLGNRQAEAIFAWFEPPVSP